MKKERVILSKFSVGDLEIMFTLKKSEFVSSLGNCTLLLTSFDKDTKFLFDYCKDFDRFSFFRGPFPVHAVQQEVRLKRL